MAGPQWLDGAERMPSSHDGGSMLGGPPRWVWHTYEAGYGLTAHNGARGLVAAGNEVHFVFHPQSGDIVQLLPAGVAARGLRNATGGVQTNRMGAVCLQVEVVARAARPWTGDLTDAGRAGLARLVGFARAHGIPDVWPAGSPPRYPPGDGNRSASIWATRGGHYGHSQVPENDHGDPGAIDPRVLFAAAPAMTAAATAATSTGGSMDLYRDSTGRIWDAGPAGRRYVTDPEVVAAYQSTGRRVAAISDRALATIPRLPDDGLAGLARIVGEVSAAVEGLRAALSPQAPPG